MTASTDPYRWYRYDYLGRRIMKMGGGTIKYCYDGDQVIAEYDYDGTLLRKFIYGPGIDEPISMIVVSGQTETRCYYHFDGLGSVIALSNLTGDLEERYSYDVFGEPNRTSSIGNPYLFTGRRYDDETGLYYYRARYYNPAIGRFMQTDPIGYEDSMNVYTYVRNNPVRFIDPFGLLTCLQCDQIYRLRVSVCGALFKVDCWRLNPAGGAVKWMICMHRARVKHILCSADCEGK